MPAAATALCYQPCVKPPGGQHCCLPWSWPGWSSASVISQGSLVSLKGSTLAAHREPYLASPGWCVGSPSPSMQKASAAEVCRSSSLAAALPTGPSLGLPCVCLEGRVNGGLGPCGVAGVGGFLQLGPLSSPTQLLVWSPSTRAPRVPAQGA